MAIATEAPTGIEAIRERLTPAFDTLDETVRQGRRTIAHGRHLAEDAAASAALKIRKRPLGAAMMAAGTGLLVGALMGFALGRFARCNE